MQKILFGINKNKRKIKNFDYLDFVCVENYLSLFSGFNSLKLSLYDDINKNLFESFLDVMFYSGILNDIEMDNQKKKNF